MDSEQVIKALEQLQSQPKRKFVQSYDLVINLKGIDVKSKPQDFFITLHYPHKKNVKVAAFVDQELTEQAGKYCDMAIKETDFVTYKDKKLLKKLAENYDYFIAQATLMPKLAAVFGRVLGTKGKMPNPKLGCVVPPNANLEPLIKKLRQTVRLQAKKATNMQCLVGKEDQPREQVVDNVLTIYNTVVKQLPNDVQNIKNVELKLTMSKPVRV